MRNIICRCEKARLGLGHRVVCKMACSLDRGCGLFQKCVSVLT